jgi:hypothetical protein
MNILSAASIFEQAKIYEKLGFSVIPLNPKSNTPISDIYLEEYQKRKPTEEELQHWFVDQEVQMNIGIVTGTISKVVVVEVDMKNGGEKSMKKIDLPMTLIIGTGNDCRHYYYQWDYKKPVPNFTGYLSGINIYGEGAYVAAPLSIHINGNPYFMLFPSSILCYARGWIYEIDSKRKSNFIKNTLVKIKRNNSIKHH